MRSLKDKPERELKHDSHSHTTKVEKFIKDCYLRMEKTIRIFSNSLTAIDMNKSLKMVIVGIGILSMLAGLFSYHKGISTNTYLGVFIGIVLIGSALLIKPRVRN